MDGDQLLLDMPTIDAGELAGLLESEVPGPEAEAVTADELQLDMSDVEDDDDGEGEGDGGAIGASAVGGEESGELNDEEIVKLGKREAKLMGKALYKRWKKLSKKASKKSRSGDEDKDKKKSSSSKKSSDSKRKEEERGSKSDKPPSKPKKRSREVATDETSTIVPAIMSAGASYSMNVSAAAHLGGGARSGKGAPAKVSAAERLRRLHADATALVQAMQEHRIRDENARRVGQPPLHRFGMMGEVATTCRRSYMHQHLVEAGILDELSNWLYDMERNELGPLDLRSLALELLLCFEVRGIRKVGAVKEDDEFDEAKAAKKVDDLDAYRGICREDLQGTSLGTAVNRLRTNALETENNKKIATLLLQRLSRAFQHRRDDDDESQPVVEVQWRCKGDPTVAPPFDPVVSASDAFQQRMFQPDPQDPMSYLRCPPRRYNKGYVTNLSHIKVASRQ